LVIEKGSLFSVARIRGMLTTTFSQFFSGCSAEALRCPISPEQRGKRTRGPLADSLVARLAQKLEDVATLRLVSKAARALVTPEVFSVALLTSLEKPVESCFALGTEMFEWLCFTAAQHPKFALHLCAALESFLAPISPPALSTFQSKKKERRRGRKDAKGSTESTPASPLLVRVDTRHKLQDRFLCHLIAAAHTTDLLQDFFDREVSNEQFPDAGCIARLFMLHYVANNWMRHGSVQGSWTFRICVRHNGGQASKEGPPAKGFSGVKSRASRQEGPAC
jgi:hypothetical protein